MTTMFSPFAAHATLHACFGKMLTVQLRSTSIPAAALLSPNGKNGFVNYSKHCIRTLTHSARIVATLMLVCAFVWCMFNFFFDRMMPWTYLAYPITLQPMGYIQVLTNCSLVTTVCLLAAEQLNAICEYWRSFIDVIHYSILSMRLLLSGTNNCCIHDTFHDSWHVSRFIYF